MYNRGIRERLTQPITKTDENANHQITVRERLTETVNFHKNFDECSSMVEHFSKQVKVVAGSSPAIRLRSIENFQSCRCKYGAYLFKIVV